VRAALRRAAAAAAMTGEHLARSLAEVLMVD
jgi:hypothetical protein